MFACWERGATFRRLRTRDANEARRVRRRASLPSSGLTGAVATGWTEVIESAEAAATVFVPVAVTVRLV